MTLPRALVLAAAILSPAAGQAQTFCERPLAPEDFPPPSNDPEFRQFLNEEYKAYMLEMEEYLNCSQREYSSSLEEQKNVLNRWLKYFGREAVLTTRIPD